MRKIEGRAFSFLLLSIGSLLILHHYFVTGRFFDLKDIFNHEFFEAILLTAGIVLLVSSFYFKE